MPVCSKHNRAAVARSLVTSHATFWINPFGLDTIRAGSSMGGPHACQTNRQVPVMSICDKTNAARTVLLLISSF